MKKRMRRIIVPMLAMTLLAGCVPDKFQFTGEIGKAGSGRGDLLSATDMGLSPDGDLVVSDAGNNRVQVLTPDGTCKLALGEYGTTGFKLSGMSGCGVNPLTGDIWVCDLRGNKLVKFNKTGAPQLKVIDKMKYPVDVAVDRQGSIYVLMSKQAAIYKYDGFGAFQGMIGGTGKTALVFATSIVIKNDAMYVADYGGRRVLKMDLKGGLIQEFNKKGDYEEMKGPSSLFVDEAGNLLVLDLGDVPVVVLAPDGQLISKIGTFGSEKGQFLYPRGIVSKSAGEISVLDNSRNCILSFKRAAQ
ncbi:MAG TPA: NHL repeat-containing protein [Candidatus Ozemobacteraceae bacterium]|nr:NHL repeat-containing protein [Candidatus Ozemobacteraceae bacterium]